MRNVKAPSRDSLLREWPLALAVVTLSAALFGKAQIVGAMGQPAVLVAVLAVLCGVILAAAVAIGRPLAEMGYRLLATRGTAAVLRQAGVAVEEILKLQEGRPNLLDRMKNGEVALVINTPSGKGSRTDEGKIRAAAVQDGVTCITTLSAAHAAVEACRALRQEPRGEVGGGLSGSPWPRRTGRRRDGRA